VIGKIPPVKNFGERAVAFRPLSSAGVLEDSLLIVIDKPSGIASHGGSGVSFGSSNRCGRSGRRPSSSSWSPAGPRHLRLAHDRQEESALVELTACLREGEVDKAYLAVVKVRGTDGNEIRESCTNTLTRQGERRVSVQETARLPSRGKTLIRGRPRRACSSCVSDRAHAPDPRATSRMPGIPSWRRQVRRFPA